MDFVELQDGSVLNPASIRRTKATGEIFRVEYIDGFFETLNDQDHEALKKAVKPKEKKARQTKQ